MKISFLSRLLSLLFFKEVSKWHIYLSSWNGNCSRSAYLHHQLLIHLQIYSAMPLGECDRWFSRIVIYHQYITCVMNDSVFTFNHKSVNNFTINQRHKRLKTNRGAAEGHCWCRQVIFSWCYFLFPLIWFTGSGTCRYSYTDPSIAVLYSKNSSADWIVLERIRFVQKKSNG